MRYFSMFSGVGGFELGIQRAFNMQSEDEQLQMESDKCVNNSDSLQRAASCIGYSEIDKYAIQTYEHNFGKEVKNYGDATTINERQLPDFDLLVGGFPCQAFSVAGKRHGFNDTRGTLFFDIARILSHKRPRHLVLENVKGLLSHDSGKTFQTILGVLTDLGYLVEWQVLNAKDFGVPQNRERVFIVGHLRGECGRQVFPIGATDREDTEPTGRRQAAVLPTIRATHYKSGDNQPVIAMNPKVHQDYRVYETEGIAPTLNSNRGGGSAAHPLIKKPTNTPEDYRCRKCEDDSAQWHGLYCPQRVLIRRLTPIECERLMSWPDNWTIGSDTQRYKQAGNGVVSNVVQAVIERMKPCLQSS